MPRPALSVKVSKSDQAALKKILAAGVEQVRVTLRAVALQRLGEGMSAPRIAAVLPLTPLFQLKDEPEGERRSSCGLRGIIA